MKDFCSLNGSIVFDGAGRHVVGGDTGATSLPWLTVQKGYCAHHFTKVVSVREMRFAPSGELLAASPGRSTVGGGSAGLGALVLVPDDNDDGIGDAPIQFLNGLESAHGMAFTPGYLYYQASLTQIRRVKYEKGDRKPIPNAPTAGEQVADITVYQSSAHWTKAIDMADDGTIYVTNGGDQSSSCSSLGDFEGGILKVDGTTGGHIVARGMRNPVRLRCQHGHNNCFALELARDSSASVGGREKLVAVHEGDDWGHPCCATKNTPFTDMTPTPDCSKTAGEENAFVIGSTPFGLDFAPSNWPAPLSNGIFITLHGVFGSWEGARIVAVGTDPVTGMPLKSSTIDPTNPTGAIYEFASGWDDMTNSHGRPAVAAFSPDGRLFIGDDVTGEIFWIAPVVKN
jgi:glucose/arabinose dehydrogenase